MRKLKILSAMGLLAASASTYSLPFMPMDARGLAMGGTGVASSRLAHAPAYNPSLLTQAQDDDDFAILFPQIGAVAADEGGVYSNGNDIKDDVLPRFDKLFANSGNDNFKASLEKMNTATTDLGTAIDALKADPTDAARLETVKTKNAALRSSITELRTQVSKVNSATDELNKKLGDISGNPLRARIGVATGFAFPGKKLAFALSIRNDLNISARATFTPKDRTLMSAYGKAVEGYSKGSYVLPDAVDTIVNKAEGGTAVSLTELDSLKSKTDAIKNYNSNSVDGNVGIIQNGELSDSAKNPEFNSTLQFAGMNITEVGISAAREFNIKGEKVSFGITPKIVSIETFHYGTSMENKEKINKDSIQQARTSYIDANIDLGASYRFDDTGWMVGATIKNLIPKSYKTSDTDIKDKNGIVIKKLKGPELKIMPQLRVGGSYENSWFTGTAELDITENDPVAFEQATRYLAFGAEFDLYDTAQFRTGLRSNLSADSPLEQSVVSLGLGLSPSIVELNLAVMVNPSTINMKSLSEFKGELGLAFEMGFAF